LPQLLAKPATLLNAMIKVKNDCIVRVVVVRDIEMSIATRARPQESYDF
jgi:hypothetical protein